MLIQILLEKKLPVSKLCDIMQVYPQVLINAKVDNNKKNEYKNNEDIQKMINNLQNEFSNDGRVIIRPSGTEPLIRVMIEGKEKKVISKKAKELASLIEDKLNN